MEARLRDFPCGVWHLGTGQILASVRLGDLVRGQWDFPAGKGVLRWENELRRRKEILILLHQLETDGLQPLDDAFGKLEIKS
jgi:hypothetical protein